MDGFVSYRPSLGLALAAYKHPRGFRFKAGNQSSTRLNEGKLRYRELSVSSHRGLESKAKQSKAKQSKAKQSKAKQSKAKQSKAKQSKAKQSKAKQSKAKQSKAKQSKAKQSKAKQSKAKQSKAKQSKAKQSKAKQKMNGFCFKLARRRMEIFHCRESCHLMSSVLKQLTTT